MTPPADPRLEALVALPPPPRPGRTWVQVNMVQSADGATSADGVSRGLSGPPDRLVFHRLRGMADAVLAGAGTVRADGYHPARADAATVAARRARGQTDVPVVVVVTGSLRLDWQADLYNAADVPTLVVHPADVEVPPQARQARTVEFATAGTGRVDMRLLCDLLAARGLTRVLCEGGPGLIGQMVAAGATDELFVTFSPQLVGGDAKRLTAGVTLDAPVPLKVGATWVSDDFVFVRYIVSREDGT